MPPLGFAGPFLTAGAGSTIPIAGGSATSGPATSGIAPVTFGTIGGGSSNSQYMPLIVGGIVLLGLLIFLRRK